MTCCYEWGSTASSLEPLQGLEILILFSSMLYLSMAKNAREFFDTKKFNFSK